MEFSMRLMAKFLIGGVVAVALGNALGHAVPISAPELTTQEKAQVAKRVAVEQTRMDASHCLGWDDSVDGVEQSVKRSLRKPSSFEHVRTDLTPVGKDGKFGAVMTFRAENGFGGMNVENVGVIVDAKTCDFQFAEASDLMQRIGS